LVNSSAFEQLSPLPKSTVDHLINDKGTNPTQQKTKITNSEMIAAPECLTKFNLGAAAA